MNLIASADRNWGIGFGNDLLFHVSPDMKFFKSKTVGNVVVMGSKTFYSFPNQKPLPDRTNIVLSGRELEIDGVTVLHSIDELLAYLERFDSDSVYVIGGQTVYEQLLPYCDTAYITKFDAEKKADKFLPRIDMSPQWYLTDSSETMEHNGLCFTFNTFKRVN